MNRADEPLPRVLMAVDLDPSQEFGTLEEQVVALAGAVGPVFARVSQRPQTGDLEAVRGGGPGRRGD